MRVKVGLLESLLIAAIVMIVVSIFTPSPSRPYAAGYHHHHHHAVLSEFF